MDFDLFSTQNQFSLLLLVIIGNVFLCLGFVHRYREQRKEIKRLKAQKQEPEAIVKRYLDDQFSKTRNKKQRGEQATGFGQECANLRMAYLRIESHSLAKQPDTPEYWQYLSETLGKLLRIIAPSKPSPAPAGESLLEKVAEAKARVTKLASNDKPAMQDKAKKLQQNLDSLAHKIKSSHLNTPQIKAYRQKIDTLLEVFEAPEKRQAYARARGEEHYTARKDDTLARMKEQCSDSTSAIDRAKALSADGDQDGSVNNKLAQVEAENARLNQYVQRLQQALETSGTSTGAPGKDLSSDELNEEIIANNEQEIERLRNVVKGQRRAMLELEELTSQANITDQASADRYQTEVDRLKQAVSESEICIKVLEDELENLRQLWRAPAEPDGTLSPQEAEVLNNEVMQLKTDLTRIETLNHQYHSLLEFVYEALTASSVEDISLLLYESITELDFTPRILLQSTDRVIELSDENKLSVREKTLIDTLHINEFNTRQSGQLSFRLQHLSGMVQPSTADQSPQELQEHIVQILKLTNTVLGQLKSKKHIQSDKKQLANAVTDIKQASFEVDELLDTFIRKTRLTLDDGLSQMVATARAKGMGATQISGLQEIEQDIQGRLKAEDTIRPKIRKKFLGLIQTMEHPENHS